MDRRGLQYRRYFYKEMFGIKTPLYHILKREGRSGILRNTPVGRPTCLHQRAIRRATDSEQQCCEPAKIISREKTVLTAASGKGIHRDVV